jgi:cobaltochelatase CobS
VTLIRHNERTGSNQTVHYAHDTEQQDMNGCYVSGRQGRVYTSEQNPCPQCKGFGKLVAIQQLPKKDYPAGTAIPEKYRVVRNGASVTQATAGKPWTTEPEPVPVASIPEPEPTGAEIAKQRQIEREAKMAEVEPTPAPVATDGAAKAISDLLATLVPDSSKIRADIEEATKGVRADVLADVERVISELMVPQRVEIVSQDKATVKVSGTVHPVFGKVLRWLSAGCKVYLVGPAGCGKTTLASQCAEALGVPFYSTGQVLSEHQVTGFVDAAGNYHTTPFRQAFEHGGLWLADEMDGWSPEALLAANAALANGHASFPDSPEMVAAHPDFYVIAAANTWGNGADREYVGRNQLDASTLDRFVSISMDYDKALELEMAGQYREYLNLVWKVRDNVAKLHKRGMIVGTRKVLFGVKGMAAGFTAQEVVSDLLRGNMDAADWDKVTA